MVTSRTAVILRCLRFDLMRTQQQRRQSIVYVHLHQGRRFFRGGCERNVRYIDQVSLDKQARQGCSYFNNESCTVPEDTGCFFKGSRGESRVLQHNRWKEPFGSLAIHAQAVMKYSWRWDWFLSLPASIIYNIWEKRKRSSKIQNVSTWKEMLKASWKHYCKAVTKRMISTLLACNIFKETATLTSFYRWIRESI